MTRIIYDDPNKVPECGYWLKFPGIGKYSVDEDRVSHAEANDYEFIVDLTDLWDWDARRYEIHGDEGLPVSIRRLIPDDVVYDAHSGWVVFERREDAEAFASQIDRVA